MQELFSQHVCAPSSMVCAVQSFECMSLVRADRCHTHVAGAVGGVPKREPPEGTRERERALRRRAGAQAAAPPSLLQARTGRWWGMWAAPRVVSAKGGGHGQQQ